METPDKPTLRPKRPWYLSWLTALVLALALLNLLRLLAALRGWNLLQVLPLSVNPLYLAVSGAWWTLVGLPLAAGLWFGWPWVWAGTQIATLVYGIYYWIDRLWLAQPETMSTRWPFALLLTIVLLVFSLGAMWAPKGKAYLQR